MANPRRRRIPPSMVFLYRHNPSTSPSQFASAGCPCDTWFRITYAHIRCGVTRRDELYTSARLSTPEDGPETK